jgi:hypothetical protein
VGLFPDRYRCNDLFYRYRL